MSFNILFTSSGRRVSLIRAFQQAMSELNLSGKIITTDLKTNAPTAFVADIAIAVPRVSDPSYIDTIKKICIDYEIKLLVPLIDTELHILSKYHQEFDKIGTRLLTCSTETNTICLDKRKTYQFFKRINVQTPEILDASYLLSNSHTKYPVLVKPADGSCSIGVTKVNNSRELEFFLEYIPNAIIQEFVEGDEYTLDILLDFQGKVRCVVPRLRLETRAGEVSKGVTVKNLALMDAGKKVAESLPQAVGCINLQCFLLTNGTIKFLEINPRFGGGFPLSYQSGANFPRWILEMMLGKQPEIALDGWQDGLMMLRYDDAVFVNSASLH